AAWPATTWRPTTSATRASRSRTRRRSGPSTTTRPAGARAALRGPGACYHHPSACPAAGPFRTPVGGGDQRRPDAPAAVSHHDASLHLHDTLRLRPRRSTWHLASGRA